MDKSMNVNEIHSHYERSWGRGVPRQWEAGPIGDLGRDFHVMEFQPEAGVDMWTYATVGMSVGPEAGHDYGLELHLHCPTAAAAHIELLTAIAHYHLTGEHLGLHHTVAFGRPWYPGSTCSYGLMSLPYLFGPSLEWLGEPGSRGSTRCLWLVPITGAERSFIIEQGGAEELEELFEQRSFNYLDPRRPSMV